MRSSRMAAAPDRIVYHHVMTSANRREPSYLALHRSGELRRRGLRLWRLLDGCALCPRRCGARRLHGEVGFCGASADLDVAACHPHFGEERPLVGRGGSGTIFMAHCGLRCVFCINYEISRGGQGAPTTIGGLARMMLSLQQQGCHNINVVTPTHYAPHVVLALEAAAGRGLKLPLVYNTCGWESPEILRLLDGIVDVYLPDFKYADADMAAAYSAGAASYPEITRSALLEMHRQVGVARPDGDGVVRRGLMIRHLVMPDGASGTEAVIDWIAAHLPADTRVTLMSQYCPAGEALAHAAIARRITRTEYAEAVARAKSAGLTNLDLQPAPL